jgi:hypothetical protein
VRAVDPPLTDRGVDRLGWQWRRPYDADVERVAAATGQPHEGIVERGTAD